MTREELKEHCQRQIQNFERVEKIMPVTPNDWKRYEEHKLILELLEQEPILDKTRTEISKDATNGDMIKALFPNIDASVSGCGDVVDVYNLGIYCQTFDAEWWNAPYEKGDKK